MTSRSWRRVGAGLPIPLVSLLMSAALVAPAQANPLAPIWTGVYFGAHGGGNWSEIDGISGSDAAGFGYGAHAGFNFAFAGLFAGIEGDASFDGAETGFSFAGGGRASFETDWSGTIRGRVGTTLGPVLLYATAGYAWTNTTVTQQSILGGGPATTKSDLSFDGVVYGIGAEAYVLPNISLRLEALRFDYGAETLSLSGAAAAAREIDPSETVVRAGVTLHLN